MLPFVRCKYQVAQRVQCPMVANGRNPVRGQRQGDYSLDRKNNMNNDRNRKVHRILEEIRQQAKHEIAHSPKQNYFFQHNTVWIAESLGSNEQDQQQYEQFSIAIKSVGSEIFQASRTRDTPTGRLGYAVEVEWRDPHSREAFIWMFGESLGFAEIREPSGKPDSKKKNHGNSSETT